MCAWALGAARGESGFLRCAGKHRGLKPRRAERCRHAALAQLVRSSLLSRAHHGISICSTTRYLALPARTLSSIALICDTGASSTCGRTP